MSMRCWIRTRPPDGTRQPTMKPIDPIFDFLTVTWDAAAQEAAFEGHCFCMLDTGRLVNSHAMPAVRRIGTVPLAGTSQSTSSLCSRNGEGSNRRSPVRLSGRCYLQPAYSGLFNAAILSLRADAHPKALTISTAPAN